MSARALRHFLDLTEIPVAELRGMIEQSRAMKARLKRDGGPSDRPLDSAGTGPCVGATVARTAVTSSGLCSRLFG